VSTTNFSVADAAFGLFGYVDDITDPTKRFWQGGDTCWIGYITGTDAVLTCDGGGGEPFYFTVDDGAPFAPTKAGTDLAIFNGLSDAPHKVVIVGNPAYTPIFGWTFASGTFLTVTGAAPAIDYGADLGPSINIALAASPCIDARSYDAYGWANANPTGEPKPSTGVTPYATGGGVYIRAKCSDLWIYSPDAEGWLSDDRGTLTRHDLDAAQVGWRKIASGLDGSSFHDYFIATSMTSGAVAPFGVMVGGAGAAFDTPTPEKRGVQFGDSITEGAVVPGASTASVDIYKAAAALGFVGQACGKSGQGAAGLASDMAAILASIHLPDVAIIAIGRNDAGGAPFRASYTEIIDALKTAGVPMILCRGVTPRADTSSVNGDIATVVAGLADPTVAFIDTSTWIDIETLDEIHPTASGYVTLGDYATAAYAPYFAPAPQEIEAAGIESAETFGACIVTAVPVPSTTRPGPVVVSPRLARQRVIVLRPPAGTTEPEPIEAEPPIPHALYLAGARSAEAFGRPAVSALLGARPASAGSASMLGRPRITRRPTPAQLLDEMAWMAQTAYR